VNSLSGEGRLFDDIDHTFWPLSRWAETSLGMTKTHKSAAGDHANDLAGDGRIPSPTILIFPTIFAILRTDCRRVYLVSNCHDPRRPSLSFCCLHAPCDRREICQIPKLSQTFPHCLQVRASGPRRLQIASGRIHACYCSRCELH